MKVAETWKIGQKKLDNGVIFIIAKQDRKMRIEVGYGLEGRLTDLYAGRIIDNDVKPHFKKDEYDLGILMGASAIMRAVKGEYPGMAEDPNIEKPFWTPLAITMISVFGGMGLIILIIIILAIKFPGAFAGGGGGSSSSWSGSSSDSSSSSSSSSRAATARAAAARAEIVTAGAAAATAEAALRVTGDRSAIACRPSARLLNRAIRARLINLAYMNKRGTT